MSETEYVQAGDYLIPNHTVETLMGPLPKGSLGKYGQMRLDHLLEHDRFLYDYLWMKGQLPSHIKEIQETASRRISQMMEERMDRLREEYRKKGTPSVPMGEVGMLQLLVESEVVRELVRTEPSKEQQELDMLEESLERQREEWIMENDQFWMEFDPTYFTKERLEQMHREWEEEKDLPF